MFQSTNIKCVGKHLTNECDIPNNQTAKYVNYSERRNAQAKTKHSITKNVREKRHPEINLKIEKHRKKIHQLYEDEVKKSKQKR